MKSVHEMKEHPKAKEAYALLHKGILALNRAEEQGIRIDLDYCYRKEKELTEQIQEIESRLFSTNFYKHWKHSLGGKKPNINSDDQLAKFLYQTKKYQPVKYTESGKGSTDEEALKGLGVSEIDDLLKMRKLRKLRDTYLKGFVKEQVNGYLHPHFNLHIARTFRSSSNAPNFQNIPKRDEEAKKITRKALYPRPGHQLLAVDYGGIEVRIAACYNHDDTMIQYIKNPESDMHGDMAQQIFMLDDQPEGFKTLRNSAKNGFVFPQFYGDYFGNNAYSMACDWGQLPKGKWKNGQGIQIGDQSLSDHLIKNNIKSIDSFTEHIKHIEKDFWERRFPDYAQWKDKTWAEYQKRGYVDMLTGFRCKGLMSYNDVTNYPIQGTAFHCLLWSFVELDRILRKKKMKTRIIGQIHDEMVIDVYPPELHDLIDLLYKIMTKRIRKHWKWIIVPLAIEVDLGDIDASWNDMEPYIED